MKRLLLSALILLCCISQSAAWMNVTTVGGGVPAAGGTPASLAGSYTTTANNDATLDWGRVGVFDYAKQSFILTGSGTVTVTSVKIYAQRVGTPGAYDAVLQIYTGTASAPDTQVTNASSQQSPAAWSTDWTWQEFTFSTPATLTLGTAYVLVLTATGNLRIDAGNKINCSLDGSASPYTDGECRYGTTLDATNSAGGDILFDVWGY